MHAIIHRLNPDRFPDAAPPRAVRLPLYDCHDRPQALHLVVYVPGSAASGIELTTQGPDLIVTARKTHHVRPNWSALHLEAAQRDYQLKLRLGRGYDYDALQASVEEGILTIVLPKKRSIASLPSRQRQVA